MGAVESAAIEVAAGGVALEALEGFYDFAEVMGFAAVDA